MVDEDGLQKPLAFVVLKLGKQGDGGLANTLQQHVRDKLQAYKYPRHIRFVASLPRNDRGKVDRRAVRALV
jgi:acyl-coenzyme A synthetase/AMP-(fatty) acid ligase